MFFAADILLLAAILYAAQQWLRRKGKSTAWALFLALPIAMTPVWVFGESTPLCQQFRNPVFFCWLKLYSVSLSACWFTWLRFTPSLNRPWVQCISFLGLPLNILEAVIQDFSTGQIVHYCNAVAGVILIATLPALSHAFQQKKQGDCRDLAYAGMTRAWVVGYTIWNWVFIYLTFPVIAGQHLAVLGVALIVGLIDPARWLQTRAYTLALALYLLFTFPTFLVDRMGTAEWNYPGGELLGASLSLGFMIVLAAALLMPALLKIVHRRIVVLAVIE